jgi:four helix bundle protein
MNKYELEERIIDYSVLILKITSDIKKTRPGSILESQIIRSGTSSALNYGEALGAESGKDFIHKVQIVIKELKETYVALKIIKKADLYSNLDLLEDALNETNQLISIFVRTVVTCKKSIQNQNSAIRNFKSF